jgi:hypothetical protein
MSHVVERVFADWSDLTSLIASNRAHEAEHGHHEPSEHDRHSDDGTPEVAGTPEAAEEGKEASDANDYKEPPYGESKRTNNPQEAGPQNDFPERHQLPGKQETSKAIFQ